VSYGNGLPERCFRWSLNCVGVQGMCPGGRDGRQAGCLVAKVQVSEGQQLDQPDYPFNLSATGRVRTCAHGPGGESCA
jgi:hypothetical protein